MGINITIDKEPDYRKVAKKLVKVDKPCVQELSALMDCMKVCVRAISFEITVEQWR